MRTVSFPFDAVVKTAGGYRKMKFENFMSFMSFDISSGGAVESLSFLNSFGWNEADEFHAEQREQLLNSMLSFLNLRYLELGFGALNIHDNLISLIEFLSQFQNLKEIKLILKAKSILDIPYFIAKSSTSIQNFKCLKIEAHFLGRAEILKILSSLSESSIETFSLEVKSEIVVADKGYFPIKANFQENHLLRSFELSGVSLERGCHNMCIIDFLNACKGLTSLKLKNIKCLDELHSVKLLNVLNNNPLNQLRLENIGSIFSEFLKRKIDYFESKTLDNLVLGEFSSVSKAERVSMVRFFARLHRSFSLSCLSVTRSTDFYALLKSFTDKSYVCALKIKGAPKIAMLDKKEIEDVGSPRDGIWLNQRLISLPKSVVESLGCSAMIDRNRVILKNKIKKISEGSIESFSLFDFQVIESQLCFLLSEIQLQNIIQISRENVSKASLAINKFKNLTTFGICKSIENGESNLRFIPNEIINHIFSFIKFREIQII